MEFLEDCLKKIKIKKTNGQEWMLLSEECVACKYCGEVNIYYCRNKRVYFKHYKNDKQLMLPFK
jgi:hypothetical protein